MVRGWRGGEIGPSAADGPVNTPGSIVNKDTPRCRRDSQPTSPCCALSSLASWCTHQQGLYHALGSGLAGPESCWGIQVLSKSPCHVDPLHSFLSPRNLPAYGDLKPPLTPLPEWCSAGHTSRRRTLGTAYNDDTSAFSPDLDRSSLKHDYSFDFRPWLKLELIILE